MLAGCVRPITHPKRSTFVQRHHLGGQCACCTLTYQTLEAHTTKVDIVKRVIGIVAACGDCSTPPRINAEDCSKAESQK